MFFDNLIFPASKPLPPPLTPEELDALCDELFGVSECPQRSRHTQCDEPRTSNKVAMRDESLSVIGTSSCSSATLALVEKPIMRTERQPAPTTQPKSKRRGRVRNLMAGLWSTFFALLAAWSFFGTPTPPVTKHVTAKPVIASAAHTPPALFQVNADPKPKFVAKAIRDIFPIADRVIAKNPESESERDDVELTDAELDELVAELMALADNEPLPVLMGGIEDEVVAFNDEEAENETIDTEPTKAEQLYDELMAAAEALATQPSPRALELTDYGPFVREHWRVIHFTLTRPDGDQVRIWLARPTWWLEAEQVKAGGKYEFDMEEVGAVGMADVLAIDECQQPPRRQNEHHRLVTGKFEHEATNVIDLYVEGQDEPIGTTANHPFWSEDRQAFVEAESLRPGENLLNAEGQRIQVITHSARPGPQVVYNLEVDGAHVYRVTDQGLLVHNTCVNFVRDASGRIVKAVAVIHTLTGGSRATAAARRWAQAVGGKLRDAGHLIGKLLGGTGNVVFPQNRHINRGTFRVFEQRVRDEVRRGGPVMTVVELIYTNTSQIPSRVIYTVYRNGRQIMRGRFFN